VSESAAPARFRPRPIPADAARALTDDGVAPLLARLLAARGVTGPRERSLRLADLAPPATLLHADHAAELLADAIAAGRRLLIVGDYDADGATATAVGLLGLRRLGAVVDNLVPKRAEHSYGLTPEIVRAAAERRPDLLITVDNGIAAHAGIDEARRLGVPVLVTDHHLPGATAPDALAIVNPNQHGCGFDSKALAGVGVMFYVLLALRAELRRRGAFATTPEPDLRDLLDLVAIGTVADVVPLDRNNRILVAHGLARLRQGPLRPGLAEILASASRSRERLATQDLGFVFGPRINAAGRMDDMQTGIDCLVTPDPDAARTLVAELEARNRERKGTEIDMVDAARLALAARDVPDSASIVLHDPGWHPGVVGLVASRVKDRLHRPVICFAQADARGLSKGSGRSIPSLHLRDALDLVDRRAPGLMQAFGGHAMAAGLTVAPERIDAFRAHFDAVVRERLTAAELERVVETDGPLDDADWTLATAESLADEVWGQGFAPPLFHDRFEVVRQTPMGRDGGHLRLSLRATGSGGRAVHEAVLFRQPSPIPDRIEAAIRLEVDEWNGTRRVKAHVEHWIEG
jgi:single-stranded-DNA-specific exonuclease